jgi:hypothetical protein
LINLGNCYRDGGEMPLTDLLIANDSEAPLIGDSEFPLDQFSGIAAKGIDSVNLTKLFHIAKRIDPTDESFIDFVKQFEYLYERTEDGPWVIKAPQQLVSLLASLEDAEKSRVALAWASTQEFKADGWSADVVGEFFLELCALAKQAVEEGRGLVMWMSL